ncbi:alpha/beta hydrolase domain-containing protein [Dyella sp. 20L07]|uniref:alpha/beta hydrolase domain-containing protein n=1 Tax=Dyella sp. 20L07 TaxID=3384240 RepID=UPI003D26FB11
MFLRTLMYLLLVPFAFAAHAEVTRVDVVTRNDVLNGHEFGATGAYERITGKVYFSVAIANAHNRSIVDLDKAVNLHDGRVEFSADFVAIQPKDPSKGNGSVLFENPNRGGSHIIAIVDGGDPDISKDAGDGWLLRNGYSIVSLGWQWDASSDEALHLYAPIARDHGKTISGLLRGDVMLPQAIDDIPLGHLIIGKIGGSEYAVAAPEDSRNTLSVRDSRDAPRMMIPRSRWRFAHEVNGELVPSDRYIHLDGGFQPGRIYEYVYVVTDPVVAGLGFAAVRDMAAYLKHAPSAIIHAQRVYGEGISQNGRFLRDFLYQGFNADEQGQIALDGVLAHVAGGGRGNFNYRFAQPSRDAGPTSSVNFATDIFPFTDMPEVDPQTGAKAGLLDRARTYHVVPKIFFSNTSYEYWGRVASLISTTPDGKRDVAISPNVRIYHLTGLQHYSVPFPPERDEGDLTGQQLQSPLPVRYFWRAMITNMDAWVRSGIEPPASSYPTITDHTLVPLSAYAFPKLPGINLPHEVSNAKHVDFGPDWSHGVVDYQPPRVSAPFAVLVPQVDADGNELDGVRLPQVSVPLATYAAWNLRDPSIGAPSERVAFEGSFLPFPRTAAEREAKHDPRPSIAERYAGREDYLARYAAALDVLIKQRRILAEDRATLLTLGAQEWDVLTKP